MIPLPTAKLWATSLRIDAAPSMVVALLKLELEDDDCDVALLVELDEPSPLEIDDEIPEMELDTADTALETPDRPPLGTAAIARIRAAPGFTDI